MNYTTAEKVKARLSNYQDEWDELVDDVVRQASARIETYCERVFGRATYTQEIYDGVNSNGQPVQRLFLKQFPVVSIATLEYRSSKAATDTWAAYNAYDYDIDLPAGILTLVGDTFPAGLRNVRITYTAGYLIDFPNEDSATHTLPADITWAATEIALRIFNNRQRAGEASENNGGSTISKLEEVEKDVREVLDKWKKVEFVV